MLKLMKQLKWALVHNYIFPWYYPHGMLYTKLHRHGLSMSRSPPLSLHQSGNWRNPLGGKDSAIVQWFVTALVKTEKLEPANQ